MKNQNKKDSLCDDLWDAVNGIQRIYEDVEDKKILITFWDRTDFLRMSQFLKIVQVIMLDSSEKTNISIESEIKN